LLFFPFCRFIPQGFAGLSRKEKEKEKLCDPLPAIASCSGPPSSQAGEADGRGGRVCASSEAGGGHIKICG
jgi:hypothetical protein